MTAGTARKLTVVMHDHGCMLSARAWVQADRKRQAGMLPEVLEELCEVLEMHGHQ